MVETLEITTVIGCPNRCSICPQDKLISAYSKLSDKLVLSLEDFKKCLSNVPDEIRIDFSGMAEPWLNKDCTDMVLYAYKKGHSIAIYTTAVGMTLDDVERIKHIPFEAFVLHLPDKEKTAKIPVTETYKKVIKAIKNANLSNFSNMTMATPEDFLYEIFSHINHTTLHSRAGNVESFKVNYETTVPTTCAGEVYPLRGVLLPNGDVTLCCMDYGLTTIIGNLLKEKYVDMTSKPMYQKIIKGFMSGDLHPLCKNCINADRGIRFVEKSVKKNGKFGISAVVVIRNESKNLIEYFQHVRRFCDEIIVIDQGSTDNSVGLSLKYADRIYSTRCKGYNEPDRIAGVNTADNSWVCTLDPDERFENAFIDKIQELIQKAEDEGYDSISCKIQNVYDGYELQTGAIPQSRLSRKSVPFSSRVHTGCYSVNPLNTEYRQFHFKEYDSALVKEEHRGKYFKDNRIKKNLTDFYKKVDIELSMAKKNTDANNAKIRKVLETNDTKYLRITGD